MRRLVPLLLLAGCGSTGGGGSFGGGPKVLFEILEPRGGAYRIDREARPVPCDVELSSRPVRIEIRTREGRTVYGELRVLDRNDWCRISTVAVDNLDARLLSGVVGGSPTIVTCSLGGTKVLELSLGNRNPND
jgi:hypothetical protein